MDDAIARKQAVADVIRARLLTEEMPVRTATVLTEVSDDNYDAIIMLPMVSPEVVSDVEDKFSDLRVLVRHGQWRRRVSAPGASTPPTGDDFDPQEDG